MKGEHPSGAGEEKRAALDQSPLFGASGPSSFENTFKEMGKEDKEKLFQSGIDLTKMKLDEEEHCVIKKFEELATRMVAERVHIMERPQTHNTIKAALSAHEIGKIQGTSQNQL